MSELASRTMTPAKEAAMQQEITRQCLAADARLALDLGTVVLWTLHTRLGFGAKRLRDFYYAMAEEHAKMRSYFATQELYPERLKLKELGVDIAAWEKELEGITFEPV